MDDNTLIKQYESAASHSIGDAKALPFRVYSNPQVADIERDRLFKRSWVFACAEAALADSGDYYVFNLAGESLALIRDKAKQLRLISNLCRHRGTPILNEGFGNAKKLVCPYHAWVYNLEGRLLAAPFSQDNEVDKPTLCLPTYHIEVWQGLVFVALHKPAYTIAENLKGLAGLFAALETEKLCEYQHGKSEVWRSNWKLVMENAMESYHLFKVHKETLETMTPTKDALYLQGENYWSLTAGKIKGLDGRINQWLNGDKHDLYSHYFLIMLPPNFVGILSYESFDWLSVLPDSEGNSQVYSGGLSKSNRRDVVNASNFVDQFFAEDKEICQRVQIGMNSCLSEGGPLLEVERIVVDFHQYLARQLFQSDCHTNYRSDQCERFF